MGTRTENNEGSEEMTEQKHKLAPIHISFSRDEYLEIWIKTKNNPYGQRKLCLFDQKTSEEYEIANNIIQACNSYSVMVDALNKISLMDEIYAAQLAYDTLEKIGALKDE